MIIGYALIVVASIAFVSLYAVRKTDTALKDKVISLASSLNMQMKLNMDSYLSRMETIGTLAFGIEESYTYDASDENNDEYEAINTEKIISDKLYSLCIMENFVDYGIVYRNNRTVGKISNGTSSLFGDGLFDGLEKMIYRQRTSDGWAAGYNDDFRRIYYVKRVHDNALLVISFYAAELETVFDNPETINGMDIRLTDHDYNILYSSVSGELGQPLQEDIMQRIAGQESATAVDNDYLVSVNSCGDWYVISSIPTKIVLKEKNEMRYAIYAAALLAALLAVLIGTELSFRLTKPVKSTFDSLDTKAHIDQLTGILNKRTFEETAAYRISIALSFEDHALILLDIDNFKGVNDTLGHAAGDKVLARTGSILRGVFSNEDYIGRIGGDEFCVLVNSSPEKGRSYTDYIKERCQELCDTFASNYAGDAGDYKISASIGVSMFGEHGAAFEELYKAADKALYSSKHKGKDTYTIYNKELEDSPAKIGEGTEADS